MLEMKWQLGCHKGRFACATDSLLRSYLLCVMMKSVN